MSVTGRLIMRIPLSFALLLLVASAAAFGASGRAPAPANSIASQYGDGWDCARGYRHAGELCVAVVVPANAYLNSNGNDWECNRGYQKSARACAAVQLPANAHAEDSSYGAGWRCDRGFRED